MIKINSLYEYIAKNLKGLSNLYFRLLFHAMWLVISMAFFYTFVDGNNKVIFASYSILIVLSVALSSLFYNELKLEFLSEKSIIGIGESFFKSTIHFISTFVLYYLIPFFNGFIQIKFIQTIYLLFISIIFYFGIFNFIKAIFSIYVNLIKFKINNFSKRHIIFGFKGFK